MFIPCRSRPSVHDLLNHPWISLSNNILPQISSTSPTLNESQNQQQPQAQIQVTPKSTPIGPRKSFACLTDATNCTNQQQQKSQQRKASATFCTEPLSTYTVTTNCLCSQCGQTCRHITHHSPVVAKQPIAIDRGILC